MLFRIQALQYFRKTDLRSLSVILLICLFLCTPIAPGQNSKENADFKLAVNLYRDGLYDLAVEQLKQFINSYPNSEQGVEARYTLGLTQMKLKQYEEARLTFQTFALSYAANPKAPEAWWNVGETFLSVRNYHEAALAFERVKVFHPKSKIAADALIKSGECFALAGERDNARRVLRIVLQEYGSSAAAIPARTSLARIYFQEGNLDQARSELKRVIESDPSADARAQALLLLGNIHLASGKTDDAAKSYQEIITKYKASGVLQEAYINLGRIAASAGQHAEAVEHLKKALAQKGPADTLLQQDAMILLGDEYTRAREYGNAVASYERALGTRLTDERMAQSLWKLASASARGKNYRKSDEACMKLLASASSEPLKRRARIRLGLNAQEQRNGLQAVRQFVAFAEQHPDDPASGDALLRAAMITEKDLHDPNKAAVLYEALASREQRNPLADDALAGSARCYDQIKEYQRALRTYRDLIERYPASDFRAAAEDRIRTINIFEAKDKDSGLEKLALLVGDVVSQKDRGGLAFQLGEIYFRDLKNYGAAAGQFATALESGLNGQRAADARFYRSRSLEYLAMRDNAMRAPAAEAYQEFLTASPGDRRAADAALAQFMLRSASLAEARTAQSELLSAMPAFARRDSILLRIGQLQEQADSLAAAAGNYDDIIHAFRDSPSAEEAGYRYVRILMRIGLVDSSLQNGIRYLAAHPASRYASLLLAQLGDASLAKGEAGQAVDLYQKLVDDFFYTPQAAEKEKSLADALAAQGKYAEAVARYQSLLAHAESDPFNDQDPDPDLLLALGRAQYLGGDYQGSKSSLFRLLSLESSGPRAGEAYTTLGMIAQSEGSVESATSFFRQASAAAPGANVTPEVADLLFASGEYGEAIRQYTALVKGARSDEERRRYESRLILSHLKNDALGEAEKMIPSFAKKYSDTDTELASFELERGNCYFRKKDYARALKSYQTVTNKYDGTPSVPEALYWTGKSLEVTSKPQEAVEMLTRLTVDYPEAPIIPRAYLALGNIFYAAEKYDEATKNYRKIVDDPKADAALLPLAMSNLIETYETAGAFDGALALTRKYIELYPNADDVLDKKIKIGILYDRLGYYDQAVLHLQSLLDEAGSDLEGELRYYIAEANYNKGDYQQAILDFLKVPYLVTKKGKIDWTANSLYMSGQAYEKMGRYEQALGMYQQIIDRPGIDGMFKAGAKKEIDRVTMIVKKKSN